MEREEGGGKCVKVGEGEREEGGRERGREGGREGKLGVIKPKCMSRVYTLYVQ